MFITEVSRQVRIKRVLFALTWIKMFFTSVIFKIIFWWMCTSVGAREATSLRAVGGRDAQPGEFPYVVRMVLQVTPTDANHSPTTVNAVQWASLCTASVLSPTATLTAAHCCTALKIFKAAIRYGSGDGSPSDNDRFSDVLNCTQPHDSTLVRADVALLTTQPISLNRYARLSAIDYPALFGQRVSLLGHGLTARGDEFNATLELKIPLQVVDAMLTKCEREDRNWNNVPPYPHICGVQTCARQTAICMGDSGGPVLHASGVLGILTSGFSKQGCYQKTYRKLDTNSMVFILPISGYIDWIADSLSKNKNHLDFN